MLLSVQGAAAVLVIHAAVGVSAAAAPHNSITLLSVQGAAGVGDAAQISSREGAVGEAVLRGGAGDCVLRRCACLCACTMTLCPTIWLCAATAVCLYNDTVCFDLCCSHYLAVCSCRLSQRVRDALSVYARCLPVLTCTAPVLSQLLCVMGMRKVRGLLVQAEQTLTSWRLSYMSSSNKGKEAAAESHDFGRAVELEAQLNLLKQHKPPAGLSKKAVSAVEGQ